MSVKFGTSGLRGLVVDLTDDVICGYVNAFLSTVTCQTLCVGQDLRPSSHDIAGVVCQTAVDAGFEVLDCQTLGTPALASYGMERGAAAIMVTGSHIPTDRNGLKFYSPTGEITKSDEHKIVTAYNVQAKAHIAGAGRSHVCTDAERSYIARYVTGFGRNALNGLRLGVYQHSSVARDTMMHVFAELGAEIVPLGLSDTFIPVDTEAVSAQIQKQLRTWCAAYDLDAIASADGDADRPLLTDAAGTLIPGDILGVLTARFLSASHVVTPVSSNDVVHQQAVFQTVLRTRIGSPFVIAGMNEQAGHKVVGFEANGGFLLGFDARVFGVLPSLPTRDCMLPILCTLVAARAFGGDLRTLVHALNAPHKASGRLQNVDVTAALALLETLTNDLEKVTAFFERIGQIVKLDMTDGLRTTLNNGDDVIHLRLSGNAPEFRIYTQAIEERRAKFLLSETLKRVQDALTLL